MRFFGDLDEIATGTDRQGEIEVTFDATRSVKDAIEACGVPHTEVGLVIVDGESVGFAHRLVGDEHVAVYPPFTQIPVGTASKVDPEPLGEDRFVADVHLGRLVRRLRILGFDTLYRNDYDDDELAVISRDQRRWLLTRDRGLLMRSAVTHGYLVRSDDPTEQAVEVLRRFGLSGSIQPYARCAQCNGSIRATEKESVSHLLEEGTRRDYDVFSRCLDCGRVYWDGSHMDALDGFVDEVRARAGRG
jgi:uncharacterized protein